MYNPSPQDVHSYLTQHSTYLIENIRQYLAHVHTGFFFSFLAYSETTGIERSQNRTGFVESPAGLLPHCTQLLGYS